MQNMVKYLVLQCLVIMKKLNNKGITTIEVIICFVLVVIISVSMFSTVSSFSEKRTVERNKEEINNYKEIVTKEIQDDFIKIGLMNVSYKLHLKSQGPLWIYSFRNVRIFRTHSGAENSPPFPFNVGLISL